MSYGWNERSAKAESKHLIGGDKPAAVFRIGKYEVTVPGEDRDDITYRVPYHTDTNPRQTLPNMEITDGEIRIPVSDLIDETLSRLDPVELATALWTNKEVRAEFCSRLTTKWGDDFTDQERREVLRDLKEAVHSKAQDRLANSMGKIEYDLAKRSFFYHEVNSINDMLYRYEQDLRSRLGDENYKLPRLRHEDHDPDFKISGKHWNDARAHWRQEVLERFPFTDEPRSEASGTAEGERASNSPANGDNP